MKTKTCCFTGHRDIPKKEYRSIKEKTEKEILTLINQGVTYFGTGGARGYDTVAAEIIIKLKKTYPHIKLILILPCANQIKGWKLSDKIKYDHITKKADKVKLLSQKYYRGCMHARNRHMVDNSAYCICYCRKTDGGTAYTVDYAIKNNLNIVHI